MHEIIIRPVTEEEYPAFVLAVIEGFADDIPGDDFVDRIRHTLPPDRTLAAFDGDAIVGTFGGYDLELIVPGGRVPMEGTTVVTVYPTHRRMGLLSRMMRIHIDNAIANGYPVAGLWASETDIYGRYGYGVAAHGQSIVMDASRIVFRDGVGIDRVRRVDAAEAPDLFPPIFSDVAAGVPGMFERSEAWWTHEVLADPEWQRKGKTTRRFVVHDGPDGPDGYAMYRLKSGEGEDGHANGTVHVIEVAAATDRAHSSLWSFLTNVDGCPNVKWWNPPMGDPLSAKLREPRRVKREARFDSLWVRILDVVEALEARTYEQDGSITFGVADSYVDGVAGVYELVISDGVGRCRRIEGDAEIEIDVDILGALYLGEVTAHDYASAGRLRGDAQDVLRMARLFMTAQRPWCNQVF